MDKTLQQYIEEYNEKYSNYDSLILSQIKDEACKKYIIEKFPQLCDVNQRAIQYKLCAKARLEISMPIGWYPLFIELCKNIYAVLKQYPESKFINVYFTQVKEKFGVLRAYIRVSPETNISEDILKEINNKIFNLIAATERKSVDICERCGEPGENIFKNGWLKALCEKHK